MTSPVLYPRKVEVIIHTPESEDVLGSIHAKHGEPVELRLTRDTYVTVIRMTIDEALDVAKVIQREVSATRFVDTVEALKELDATGIETVVVKLY